MTIINNKNLQEAAKLVKKLIILADKGETESKDDGCRILYCVMRDCAYKIQAQVKREDEEHRKRGVRSDNFSGF
ncbi:MAG: hypothetical protein HZA48_03450 [Planctomycetes bacterium]|nr:hypothetical protein [Planctomycetota bacterium]